MLGRMPETSDQAEDLPVRQFGWWDMFVSPQDDPRAAGSRFEGERATLAGYLRDQRLTLELKCAGLDAEAMARRSVPPSDLSLLGLVRHLAETERSWFRRTLAGQDVPRLYRTADEPERDFSGAVPDPARVRQDWANWREEVAFAEQFVADAPNLEVAGLHDDGAGHVSAIALREVMVHMIEEYARHNGHADLLRERIDGRVGQ